MNNFKTIFETQLNSRTNTEVLLQLIEQTLYRYPGYCTEMRSYLGSLQQANMLSLDVYAILVAEVTQFEEKHLSITFEYWRTHPEHALPQATSPLAVLQTSRQYQILIGGSALLLVVLFVLWTEFQHLNRPTPPAPPLSETSESLPTPISPPPPTVVSPLVSETTPPPPPAQPLLMQSIPQPAPVNVGDVEPPLPATTTPTHSQQSIEQLLKTCQTHVKAQRLTSGKGETALTCYRNLLKIDENNQAAQEGLQAMEKLYADWAEKAFKKKQLNKVQDHLRAIEMINPNSPLLAELRQKLAFDYK